MTRIIWNDCRRADGTISLEMAAKHTGCHISEEGMTYLRGVESLMLINSRQAAAIAIANALGISARTPSDG